MMLSLLPTSFEMVFRVAAATQDAVLGAVMALVGNLSTYLGAMVVP